jgi:hypothetical protein
MINYHKNETQLMSTRVVSNHHSLIPPPATATETQETHDYGLQIEGVLRALHRVQCRYLHRASSFDVATMSTMLTGSVGQNVVTYFYFSIPSIFS